MARIKLLKKRIFWITLMLLNKYLMSILTCANDKHLIDTVDVQDNSTLQQPSTQLSINPPITSVDSKSKRCQHPNDKTVSDSDSTNILTKCGGEIHTEIQELEEITISDGSETRNIDFVEQSIENDFESMTTPLMDITVKGLESTLPPVRILMLYHMMWCIHLKIVQNHILWPHSREYGTCRSPIIHADSIIMQFKPPSGWLNAHMNVLVLVTESRLNDIAWCAQNEFKLNQIMFLSFYNILKHCSRTEEFADIYGFNGGGPDKPPMLILVIPTVALYHIIWCVQNESLPFKGLPMYPDDLRSCQSPLIPFNKEAIQGSINEWWGSSESLRYKFRILGNIFINLLNCAKNNIFISNDMINPDSMISACNKIMDPGRPIEIVDAKQRRNVEKTSINLGRMFKPIYICLGVITLLFGSLGNLITCVIALRAKIRKTSSGIYMSALAIIDTVFLYIRIIPQILVFFKVDLGIRNNFICKMVHYFIDYVDYLSAWWRLCFAMERTLAITSPYTYRVYFTRRVTLAILLTCSVILAALSSPVLFSMTSNGENCMFQKLKWLYISAWINVVLSTILPFTGIIVSNSIMIYNLCKARRQRQRLTDGQVNVHKITIMCISTSLCFVLSNAPLRVYAMSKNYYFRDSRPEALLALRTDIMLLLECCRYINGTLNFMLYFISGSVFREEVLKLFKGTH